MDDSTIDRRLENLLTTAEHDMQMAFSATGDAAALQGALQSSGYLLSKARDIGRAMAAFVTAALADVDAVQRAGGSLSHFYETTTTKLIQLKLRGMEDIRRRADAWHSPTALQPVGTEVERQYLAARALLEDHKAGFGRVVTPNSDIHIQAGPGAIVQANSPGAWAQVNIDAQAIRQALSDFEGALPWEDFDPTQVAEIRAEVETIKAQLGKAAPSSTILQESGRSLRAIMENLVASAAQPFVWQGGRMLWQALGLGA